MTPPSVSEISLLIPSDGTGLRFDDHLTISLGQSALPLGTLRLHDSLGTLCSAFRFDRAWLRNPGRFSVSPDLRAVDASQWVRQTAAGGAHVFATLADTVPRGFGAQVLARARATDLLARLGAPEQQSEASSALCGVLGHARLGALRVQVPRQPFADPRMAKLLLPCEADLDNMWAIARAFAEDRETPRQLLLMLYAFTALGGGQPKCSFVAADGQLRVAKYFGKEHPAWMPRAEVLFTTLARAAGLNAVEARLFHPVFSPVVITQRFDRCHQDDRVPYMSARALLQVSPADQVNWLDLLAQMRLYSKNLATDALAIWRRLVFSRLIGKAPDTVDDFGFLYVGHDKWRLAPACGMRPDLAVQACAPSDGLQLLGVPGDIEALLHSAPQFGLTPANAADELKHQLNVLKTWKRRALEFAVNMEHRDIDQLAPLIDNSHVRLAIELVGA